MITAANITPRLRPPPGGRLAVLIYNIEGGPPGGCRLIGGPTSTPRLISPSHPTIASHPPRGLGGGRRLGLGAPAPSIDRDRDRGDSIVITSIEGSHPNNQDAPAEMPSNGYDIGGPGD